MTRLATRIALGGYRGRSSGFYQDGANILVYRRPYCIKFLLVKFRHLWLGVKDDCRSPYRIPIEALQRQAETTSRSYDTEQLQERF